MKQHELIHAALTGKATLVIKDANVVNVFTGEIIRGDVALYEDTIIGVGQYSCQHEIQANGAYLCPGFIDGHVHIESSMVIPESFARVVQAAPTRVAIAGGNGCKTAQDFIQMTRDVMDAGAAGVTYGRFVFQYPHVTPLVKTLGQVVHNGLSVKEAMELLDTLEHEDA